MIRNNILLVVMILSTALSAQTTMQIDYTSFQDQLLQYHPLAVKASNESKIGAYKRKAAIGNYDPNISGALTNKHFNGKSYYTRASVDLKQSLFANQYLKFGYEFGEGLNLNPEDMTPTGGLAFVGVEIGLLQGLSIDKRRAELLKSSAYVNYHTAESKKQLNDLLLLSSTTYMHWLFTSKTLQLNERFLQAARKRTLALQSMAENGEKAAIDTVEAAILFQGRNLDFQNATNDKQKLQNELLSQIWTSEGATALNSGLQLQTTDSLETYFQRAQRKYAELVSSTPSLNPSIEKFKALQSVLKVEARYRKEMQKPILNLQYNLLNDVQSQTQVNLNSNYKWGLQLQMPLFRSTKNEYTISKTEFENLGLELTNKSNELNFKLQALRQSVDIVAQQILVAERTAKYSQQLLEAENWRFENGESSLFLLNTRENKWLDSEIKLAEYKLKFIHGILQLVYLSGTLNFQLANL